MHSVKIALWCVSLVFYVQPVNQWDKAVDLKGFEVTGIQNKVELILDSSGTKIKHIKGSHVVESTMEGARGIWSGLHIDVPFKIDWTRYFGLPSSPCTKHSD